MSWVTLAEVDHPDSEKTLDESHVFRMIDDLQTPFQLRARRQPDSWPSKWHVN